EPAPIGSSPPAMTSSRELPISARRRSTPGFNATPTSGSANAKPSTAMISREKTGDYEGGYGKRPRHTRFAKGQSGNPRGRPSGAKNFKTLLSEALNEPVIVTENGGRRKVTKRQAIITQLVNRSATADWRAIKILLDLVRDIEGQTEPASPQTSAFSEADEKVIEQLKMRFSKGEK